MNLHLVKPAAPIPKAPSVLNESFQSRIHTLNHAIRELRLLGLKVVWTGMAGPIPSAVIQRDTDVSIKPLLDRITGQKRFVKHLLGTVISGLFEGVYVSWIEPTTDAVTTHTERKSDEQLVRKAQ